MPDGRLQLQVDGIQFTQNLANLLAVAKELNTRYSDNVQAPVNALALNGDLLPGTQLTKLQWNQFNQMTADLIAFMENAAVATSWRRPICNQIANCNKT